MYTLEKIKKDLVKTLNQALGKKFVQAKDIVYPPNSEMGDLSLPLFVLAKEMDSSPVELSSDLISKIDTGSSVFSSVNAAGPYLNFRLKKDKLAEGVLGAIAEEKEKYGKNKLGKKKKVMIEYSNANTHKEFHVGHIRNIVFGDAVNRLLDVNGYKSIPVSYINDFGIHVAKTLWALQEFYKDAEIPENQGEFLGQVYVRATQEAKENPLAKKMIEGIMKKIESREGEEYEKWQMTRVWTIEQFDQIYKELEIEFEKTYYESEFIDKGRKQVNDLIKKGILRESEGAIIADLEKEDLGVLVVIRSDGTATYPVADIPLAEAKFKDYNLDTSIYVVDNRQKLYFKQLFKILEHLGYSQKKVHLEYDFVKLPSGMMSSRSGNTVTYETLKKELMKVALKETKSRHQDWDKEKVEATAWEIVKGAMKFEMLKVGTEQVITFDIEKALSFQGYTAAYIQYTYARIQSILKKSGTSNKESGIEGEVLTEEKEHKLVLKLAKYPEIVERAGRRYDPSEIAKYLFELAQELNDYYHAISILKADEKTRNARLMLIEQVAQIIKNGLKLLGINVVEEM